MAYFMKLGSVQVGLTYDPPLPSNHVKSQKTTDTKLANQELRCRCTTPALSSLPPLMQAWKPASLQACKPRARL
jgi:hypothetical protein